MYQLYLNGLSLLYFYSFFRQKKVVVSMDIFTRQVPETEYHNDTYFHQNAPVTVWKQNFTKFKPFDINSKTQEKKQRKQQRKEWKKCSRTK